MVGWDEDTESHDGAQMHVCIQHDPLGMRTIKLDIGVWAECECEHEGLPDIGDKVFVIHEVEEDKWYWLGYMRNGNVEI